MIGLSTLRRLYIQKGGKVPLFNQATLFMMNQELLYKYFKGTASIEEEKQILDWVEASEEHREAYLKERMLFDVSLFSTKQDNKKKAIRLMPTLRWAARIAAAVIIAVSGYYMTTNYIYNKERARGLNFIHNMHSLKPLLFLPGNAPKLRLPTVHAYGSMPNPRLHMLPTSVAMTATSS